MTRCTTGIEVCGTQGSFRCQEGCGATWVRLIGGHGNLQVTKRAAASFAAGQGRHSGRDRVLRCHRRGDRRIVLGAEAAVNAVVWIDWIWLAIGMIVGFVVVLIAQRD